MDQSQATTTSASSSARRSLKRKLEPEFEDRSEEDRKVFVLEPREAQRDLVPEVLDHVNVLNSALSSDEPDRAASKTAASVIAELAKNGTVFAASDRFRFRFRYRSCICICMRTYVCVAGLARK